MHWRVTKVFLLGIGGVFCFFPSVYAQVSETIRPRVEPELKLNGLYGQSSGFWDAVHRLETRHADPATVDQLFDSVTGSPKEGIASLNYRYEAPVDDALRGFLTHGYFSMGVDALAGGDATDRIYPSIRGYEVYTGHAEYGLFSKAASGESGWEYGMSATLGGGQQKLVQGDVAEFLSGVPTQNFSVFYWGGSLFLGHSIWWSETLRSRTRFSFLPTVFYSDFSDSSYVYRISSQQFTPRWKVESEWLGALDVPWGGGSDLGMIFVSGQQPVPVDILPRTWDSVHDLKFYPAVGSLLGLGSLLQFHSPSRLYQFRMVGGYFGGYLGAGAELMLNPVVLTGGTWGFEETSSFHGAESRIQYVALGVRFGI